MLHCPVQVHRVAPGPGAGTDLHPSWRLKLTCNSSIHSPAQQASAYNTCSPGALLVRLAAKLHGVQGVDQLAAGTADKLAELIRDAAGRAGHPEVHVLEVAIRNGCILVSADLLQATHGAHQPLEAMRLAERLVPELLKHLHVATAEAHTDKPLLSLQVGDTQVLLHWDSTLHTYKLVQQGASPDSALLGHVRLGLVWQRPLAEEDQLPDSSTGYPQPCHQACVMAVLLGVTKENIAEVLGSHPHTTQLHTDREPAAQASGATSQPSSSSSSPATRVLQLWALGQQGYLPVRVLEACIMPPGSHASLVKLLISLPQSYLIRHHPTGPPTFLQHIKLELWVSGSLKLDSTQVLLAGRSLQPALVPACSWWGLPVGLASDMTSELNQLAQDMWTQRASSAQDMDSQRSVMNDLVLWLDGCRAAQSSTGSCVSQHVSTRDSTCHTHNALPMRVVVQLGKHLLTHARQHQLHKTSAVLQYPQPWTSNPAAAPATTTTTSSTASTTARAASQTSITTVTNWLYNTVAPLKVAALGFPCPLCEQLYGSSLQPYISQSCKYLYIVMASCGEVSLAREQQSSESLVFWSLVVLWLALQGGKGLLLLSRGVSPAVLRLVSVLHLMAYMSRLLGTALVALHRVPMPSSTLSQHQAGSWVLLYTASSVSEHVPMRGMVPTWMVTALSLVMTGLHLQLCHIAGVHSWLSSITGCLASTLLAPLLIDAHLRSRLMPGQQAHGRSAGKGVGSRVKALTAGAGAGQEASSSNSHGMQVVGVGSSSGTGAAAAANHNKAE